MVKKANDQLRTWLFENRYNKSQTIMDMWYDIHQGKTSKLPEFLRSYGTITNVVQCFRNGMYTRKSDIPNADLGLFCSFTIPQNTLIGNYTGNILSSDNYHNYLKNIEMKVDRDKYVSMIWEYMDADGTTYYIDPEESNKLKYVNEPPPGRIANIYAFHDVKHNIIRYITYQEIPAHTEMFIMYGSNEESRDYPVGVDCGPTRNIWKDCGNFLPEKQKSWQTLCDSDNCPKQIIEMITHINHFQGGIPHLKKIITLINNNSNKHTAEYWEMLPIVEDQLRLKIREHATATQTLLQQTYTKTEEHHYPIPTDILIAANKRKKKNHQGLSDNILYSQLDIPQDLVFREMRAITKIYNFNRKEFEEKCTFIYK